MRFTIHDLRFTIEARRAAERRSIVVNRQSSIAFTLIELLVVISIMGLIAALAVPALKELGKSNIQTSASRQMLDDIGHGRQLAISQHTTVYMVFVPTNYFSLMDGSGNTLQADVLGGSFTFPTPPDQVQAALAMSNLVNLQLSGYNFISDGQVGDQPGQHSWHYLSTWQSLPDGTFIAAAKFLPENNYMTLPTWQASYAGQIDAWVRISGNLQPQINGFAAGGPNIPFPTEKSPKMPVPYIAFDSTGRLISEMDGAGNVHHAYIPLAQGSVIYPHDVNKRPILGTMNANDIVETPPGNSTNISFNVIDIDPLSGRAKLDVYQLP